MPGSPASVTHGGDGRNAGGGIACGLPPGHFAARAWHRGASETIGDDGRRRPYNAGMSPVRSDPGPTSWRRAATLAVLVAAFLAWPTARDVAAAPEADAATLSPPAVPGTVGRDTRFAASGVLAPAHPSGPDVVTLLCYRREADGWTERAAFAAGGVDRDPDSSVYRGSVTLPSAGVWRLRALHEDAEHGPAWSDWSESLTVTDRRDAPIWDRDGVTTIPERMASRLDARQLVVVTGARLGSRTGRLRVYDYAAGDWLRRTSVPVRLGTNGLVNGLNRRARRGEQARRQGDLFRRAEAHRLAAA